MCKQHKDVVPSSNNHLFNKHAGVLGGGVGGALISHVGCLGIPFAAAVAGVAVSGTAMFATMMIASPVIAVAATYAIEKKRHRNIPVKKMAGAAITALALSFVVAQFISHDYHTHPEASLSSEQLTWAKSFYAALGSEQQEELRIKAQQNNVSVYSQIASAYCRTEETAVNQKIYKYQ